MLKLDDRLPVLKRITSVVRRTPSRPVQIYILSALVCASVCARCLAAHLPVGGGSLHPIFGARAVAGFIFRRIMCALIIPVMVSPAVKQRCLYEKGQLRWYLHTSGVALSFIVVLFCL